jgi:alkylation response protein AidB-like acyl-CoA dehydrogenase
MTGTISETREAATVREEVRAFLKRWDPKMPAVQWRGLLADTGWGLPTWPREWHGRGLSRELARIVAEEFAEAGATGVAGGLAVMLAGPTIIAHGSDEQKRRFLRPIVTGEEPWCQLFSEPGAGSDLAGVQTRAVRHGDEWIVNGQKVWTSGAVGAAFGMLVARTDPDVPKHQGISYFALDMRQPGVDVRPLKQMNGGASFNEVFFTDARVPSENLIGGENNGWGVALTTLANERVGLGGGGVMVGSLGGRRPAPSEQQAERMRRGGRGGRQVAALAQSLGKWDDPVVRQQVVQLYMLQEVARFNALRSRAAAQAGGRPGPEGSLGKLSASRISHYSAKLNVGLLGAGGMLTGTDAPGNGAFALQLLSMHGSSIAGGTDEIQHNIIGERVLGLPKEPQVDRDIPFKDVKVGTQKP